MSSLENAALLGLVALLPLVVLMLTSFVKVSVVLSLLRNAIGATDAPSGLVITGLSLVLTFFVMAPVAVDMAKAAQEPAPTQPAPAPGPPTPAPPGPAQPTPRTQPAPAPATMAAPTAGLPAPTAQPTQAGTAQPGSAWPPATTPAPPPGSAAAAGQPTPAGAAQPATAWPPPAPPAAQPARQVDVLLQTLVPAQYRPQVAAVERAVEPLRAFLVKHTRAADRETFAALGASLGNSVTGTEIWVLAPAFIATELREAFLIAILIFVPFLVIDLVVSLSLAALGLSTTSPQTVALPLKLVLFVAVDGWRLLLDGLLRGYV